jgi:hypothetical protein
MSASGHTGIAALSSPSSMSVTEGIILLQELSTTIHTPSTSLEEQHTLFAQMTLLAANIHARIDTVELTIREKTQLNDIVVVGL